jgi:hypothetical protein
MVHSSFIPEKRFRGNVFQYQRLIRGAAPGADWRYSALESRVDDREAPGQVSGLLQSDSCFGAVQASGRTLEINDGK